MGVLRGPAANSHQFPAADASVSLRASRFAAPTRTARSGASSCRIRNFVLDSGHCSRPPRSAHWRWTRTSTRPASRPCGKCRHRRARGRVHDTAAARPPVERFSTDASTARVRPMRRRRRNREQRRAELLGNRTAEFRSGRESSRRARPREGRTTRPKLVSAQDREAASGPHLPHRAEADGGKSERARAPP